MTTKQKLNFIDEVLERLEDTAHGADSTDLSTARKYCRELIGVQEYLMNNTPSGLIGLTNFIEGKADYNIRTRAGITVDWNEAPEWANYHAVDASGEGYWYENEPMVEGGLWVERSKCGRVKPSKKYKAQSGAYAETLTKRP